MRLPVEEIRSATVALAEGLAITHACLSSSC